MAEIAIEIHDVLVIDRKRKPLLRIDHFVLPHGESCGLYGGISGGAFLLLDCVAGDLRVEHGSICIDGTPLTTSRRPLSTVGVMPRTGAVFPDYTLGENLDLAARSLMPGRRRSEDRTRNAAELVSRLDLKPWVHTTVRRVADGVRQRLSLACALVHGPRLLVADDPFGSSDPESRTVIDRVLREHCDTGNTLLFASPREQEIISLSSEICLFDNSTMIARGTHAHLCRFVDRHESIVVRVQDHAGRLAERVMDLPGVLRCDQDGASVTIEATAGSVRLTRLADLVQHLGLELLDLHVDQPSLSHILAAAASRSAAE